MKLIMKLKSDCIPGSGNSIAGIIDRDIVYDRYGLPYIPAKRLKGILRESAEDLRIDNDIIDKIFGIEGQEKATNFILDNGTVESYLEIIKLLDFDYIKEFLPPQVILDFFSYTRAQTKIKEGVAEDKSLRISRVLKKGLSFEFECHIPNDYHKEFNNICKVTRSFGSSRNRGFGEILLTFIADHNQKQNQQSIQISNSKELAKFNLSIYNQEQLLLSSTPGQNQVVTDDYVSGSMVLGAIAAEYIKQKGVDDHFYELFTSGKVTFGNLYPFEKNAQERKDFYPSPLSIKKVKNYKETSLKADYYDCANLKADNSYDKVCQNVIFKGSMSGFVTENLNHSVEVLKGFEAHHQRPEERSKAKASKDQGTFFQFEVLEQNQAFSGFISGPSNLIEEILSYLPQDGYIRLGKSKTGQYGKCTFETSEIELINNEDFELDKNEEVKLVLKSDLIILNENGYPEFTPELFINQFCDIALISPQDVELTDVFLKTKIIGGFMGVWKMPRIQKNSVKAGTVIVLKNISQKTITVKNINNLRIGDRIEDGFGKIGIYNNEEIKIDKPVKSEIKLDRLSNMTNMQILNLIKYQQNNIIERELKKRAFAECKDNLPLNTFMSKYLAMLKDSKSFDDFNSKLKKLNSNSQDSNLRKIHKKLFLKNIGKAFIVDNDSFKESVMQHNINKKIIDNFGLIDIDNKLFEYYQLYITTLINHQKNLNRRKAS